ncbi:MAG: hypothetical protein AAF602_16150 [Myxococcota bacterium]
MSHAMLASSGVAVVVLALAGCGSGVSDEAPEMPLASLGWAVEVVEAPARFTELVTQGRDGWVALHAHDYPAARRAFRAPGVGRFRAELALATLHDDLARIGAFGTSELFTAWQARGSLPSGPEAPLVAALGVACAGGDASGWATQVLDGPDVALARRLAAGESPFDVGGSDSPVSRRLALHRAVRAGERPVADLADAATTPLLVKAEADGGFTREFWDPCVGATLATRSIADALSAADAVGGVSALPELGLGMRIFGAWPTVADVRRVVAEPSDAGSRLRALGTTSGLLDALGSVDAVEDDVDAAKQWLRELDRGLDHWSTQLSRNADADGRALLGDLRLIPRLRQEVGIAKAREALRQGRPRQAAALLELARDPSEGLGPANAPALFALLAETHLRLGRTREAMDAIQPLIAVFPWLEGTRETLGDWAVLEGLDRRGDSKENP